MRRISRLALVLLLAASVASSSAAAFSASVLANAQTEGVSQIDPWGRF